MSRLETYTKWADRFFFVVFLLGWVVVSFDTIVKGLQGKPLGEFIMLNVIIMGCFEMLRTTKKTSLFWMLMMILQTSITVFAFFHR